MSISTPPFSNLQKITNLLSKQTEHSNKNMPTWQQYREYGKDDDGKGNRVMGTSNDNGKNMSMDVVDRMWEMGSAEKRSAHGGANRMEENDNSENENTLAKLLMFQSGSRSGQPVGSGSYLPSTGNIVSSYYYYPHTNTNTSPNDHNIVTSSTNNNNNNNLGILNQIKHINSRYEAHQHNNNNIDNRVDNKDSMNRYGLDIQMYQSQYERVAQYGNNNNNGNNNKNMMKQQHAQMQTHKNRQQQQQQYYVQNGQQLEVSNSNEESESQDMLYNFLLRLIGTLTYKVRVNQRLAYQAIHSHSKQTEHTYYDYTTNTYVHNNTPQSNTINNNVVPDYTPTYSTSTPTLTANNKYKFAIAQDAPPSEQHIGYNMNNNSDLSNSNHSHSHSISSINISPYTTFNKKHIFAIEGDMSRSGASQTIAIGTPDSYSNKLIPNKQVSSNKEIKTIEQVKKASNNNNNQIDNNKVTSPLDIPQSQSYYDGHYDDDSDIAHRHWSKTAPQSAYQHMHMHNRQHNPIAVGSCSFPVSSHPYVFNRIVQEEQQQSNANTNSNIQPNTPNFNFNTNIKTKTKHKHNHNKYNSNNNHNNKIQLKLESGDKNKYKDIYTINDNSNNNGDGDGDGLNRRERDGRRVQRMRMAMQVGQPVLKSMLTQGQSKSERPIGLGVLAKQQQSTVSHVESPPHSAILANHRYSAKSGSGPVNLRPLSVDVLGVATGDTQQPIQPVNNNGDDDDGHEQQYIDVDGNDYNSKMHMPNIQQQHYSNSSTYNDNRHHGPQGNQSQQHKHHQYNITANNNNNNKINSNDNRRVLKKQTSSSLNLPQMSIQDDINTNNNEQVRRINSKQSQQQQQQPQEQQQEQEQVHEQQAGLHNNVYIDVGTPVQVQTIDFNAIRNNNNNNDGGINKNINRAGGPIKISMQRPLSSLVASPQNPFISQPSPSHAQNTHFIRPIQRPATYNHSLDCHNSNPNINVNRNQQLSLNTAQQQQQQQQYHQYRIPAPPPSSMNTPITRSFENNTSDRQFRLTSPLREPLNQVKYSLDKQTQMLTQNNGAPLIKIFRQQPELSPKNRKVFITFNGVSNGVPAATVSLQRPVSQPTLRPLSSLQMSTPTQNNQANIIIKPFPQNASQNKLQAVCADYYGGIPTVKLNNRIVNQSPELRQCKSNPNLTFKVNFVNSPSANTTRNMSPSMAINSTSPRHTSPIKVQFNPHLHPLKYEHQLRIQNKPIIQIPTARSIGTENIQQQTQKPRPKSSINSTPISNLKDGSISQQDAMLRRMDQTLINQLNSVPELNHNAMYMPVSRESNNDIAQSPRGGNIAFINDHKVPKKQKPVRQQARNMFDQNTRDYIMNPQCSPFQQYGKMPFSFNNNPQSPQNIQRSINLQQQLNQQANRQLDNVHPIYRQYHDKDMSHYTRVSTHKKKLNVVCKESKPKYMN